MHLRSLILFVPVATALLYACGDTGSDPADADVILEGAVTDETFVAMSSALDQAKPTSDPAKAATLDMPADGAALPRATAPVFTWHIGAPSSQVERLPGKRWAGLELLPAPAPAKAWTPLRELFGPIRAASAHGEPFNGTGTYLVFSTDTDPKLVRAFTGATTYTPSQAAWGKMTGAGKQITLTLVSALFEQDRVVPGGGPFAGSTIKFTVAP
jgi:hypothetical protein